MAFRFHTWATGRIDLCLLAISEAVSECFFLERSNEGKNWRADSEDNEVNEDLEDKDEKLGKTLTKWNIEKNLIWLNLIDRWKSTEYNEENESELQKNRKRKSQVRRRIDCSNNNSIQHGSLADLGHWSLFRYRISPSRNLFHVYSLLFQSCLIQSTLLSSIGSIKDSSDICIKILSIIIKRNNLPLCIITLLIRYLENQVRRIPFDQINEDCQENCGYKKSITDQFLNNNIDSSDDIENPERRGFKTLSICQSLVSFISSILGNAVVDVTSTPSQRFTNLWPNKPSICQSIQWIVERYGSRVISNRSLSINFSNVLQSRQILQNIACMLLDSQEGKSQELVIGSQSRELQSREGSRSVQLSPLETVMQTVNQSLDNVALVCLSLGGCEAVVKIVEQFNCFLENPVIQNHESSMIHNGEKWCPDFFDNETRKAIRLILALLISLVAVKFSEACLDKSQINSSADFAIDILNRIDSETFSLRIQSALSSITSSIVILRAQHLRCFWTFSFRRLQKQSSFFPTTQMNFSHQHPEQIVEFLFRHHCDHQRNERIEEGMEENHDIPGSCRRNKLFQMESIPYLWTLVYVEVQSVNGYRRLRCWRYFTSEIVKSIKNLKSDRKDLDCTGCVPRRSRRKGHCQGDKVEVPTRTRIIKTQSKTIELNLDSLNNSTRRSNATGKWVFLCTDWMNDTKWDELEEQLASLRKKNIITVQRIDLNELDKDRDKKFEEKQRVQEWWSQR